MRIAALFALMASPATAFELTSPDFEPGGSFS